VTAAGRSQCLLLEGGGSHTWIALTNGHDITATATGPSTNPRSVGQEQAEQTVTSLVAGLLEDHTSDVECVTAAHGAASTTTAAGQFASLLRRACASTRARAAAVRLTNDITPVLLAAPGDQACVVIAGTGTGYAARNGQVFARASGLEWLLSDEGGGHDLAVAGLRAAIRALDGRGPATLLTEAAHGWSTRIAATADLPVPDRLFNAVYLGYSKPLVATFAAEVIFAASAGDSIALALIEHAASELAAGAQAVCRATGLLDATGIALILSGTLLTGATILADRLLARLPPHLAAPVPLSGPGRDPATAMLTLHQIWLSSPHILTAAARSIPTVTLAAPP